ncbi:transcriptional regulator with XRE-family HTH domain [Sporomusaceae bacterium BoRhaA]|uniref:helix-turn-helix domain-containing protein n=1 Tax=Pelorhabdus rhamnosifermentans TaxID=2772457 RepID=UPI001C060DD4|nr:helix-turn-helix transcriptional regulator [Pelorhabdus rhamnosifermentans]MBU2703381.1 transcriptional regulator with XRE-family HTH domain [Pelorhabdus rhamnosifermentans]
MMEKIIEQIKAERIRKKVTMDELAIASGVSQKHISNIENYKVKPTLETLEKLAKSLGLEIGVSLKEVELLGNSKKNTLKLAA